MEATNRCGCGRNLSEVETQLPDDVVTLVSCSHCDVRWWLRNGAPVAPAVALGLIGRSWSKVRSGKRAADLVAA